LAADADCGGCSLRERLLAQLPIHTQGLQIRRWTRFDLGRLAGWPGYPSPYDAFAFSFRSMAADELDALYAERQADPARLSLVVDRASECAIGYLALLDVDWDAGSTGNLALRIHPRWCGCGIGTAVLRWAFASGMKSVDLDVAASNARAYRCYEKAGFETVGEIWRPAPDLAELDLTSKRFAIVAPHVRYVGDAPQLRFLVMRSSRAQ